MSLQGGEYYVTMIDRVIIGHDRKGDLEIRFRRFRQRNYEYLLDQF
jgi:hypothetical protein